MQNVLVSPKDKDRITQKSGIIYWFKCDRLDCEDEYIGVSSKTSHEKFREHLKASSPKYEHQNTTAHTTYVENFKTIGSAGALHCKSNQRSYLHKSQQPHP